jgi:hypothetical protein
LPVSRTRLLPNESAALACRQVSGDAWRAMSRENVEVADLDPTETLEAVALRE